MPLAVGCTNEEKLPITCTPLSAGGKPASFDGPIRVTVQSGDGTVEQDPATPNVFMAVSGDALADTVYLVEGDADLGAGQTEISDTVTLTVGSASAVSFGMTAGAAVPK
jgi:hypothetical protein